MEKETETETKTIVILPTEKETSKKIAEKEKKKRKITQANRWRDISVCEQMDLLNELVQMIPATPAVVLPCSSFVRKVPPTACATPLSNQTLPIPSEVNGYSETKKLLVSQLSQKLSGYKSQDMEKKKYSEKEFIQLHQLFNLLKESKMECCYCHEPINMLYEHVREPKQWSLDRIDNDKGHNHDNVCISCLSCNLKRKTIHYPRFFQSKHMVFVKVP